MYSYLIRTFEPDTSIVKRCAWKHNEWDRIFHMNTWTIICRVFHTLLHESYYFLNLQGFAIPLGTPVYIPKASGYWIILQSNIYTVSEEITIFLYGIKEWITGATHKPKPERILAMYACLYVCIHRYESIHMCMHILM